MKKIFLIQAHKDIILLNDLIEQLNHPDFVIYLHLDYKSNINLKELNPDIILVKNRINVCWGEFSQVEATLSGLKQISEEQNEYSHVIFISGQDYPLKSKEFINDFLDNNLDKSFMQYFQIPEDGKYSNYRWRFDHKHYPKKEIFKRKINSLLIRLGFIKLNQRKFLLNYKYYWGSQWWILTKDVVNYVLEESTSKMKKYFKYVFCSDELYFQTLILNSDKNFKINNDVLKFMIWEEFNHPRILELKDYDSMLSSDALFCRKVDSVKSKELLNKLKYNNK